MPDFTDPGFEPSISLTDSKVLTTDRTAGFRLKEIVCDYYETTASLNRVPIYLFYGLVPMSL